MLLMDSWTGQSERRLQECVATVMEDVPMDDHDEDCRCGELEVDVATIPAGTTGKCGVLMKISTMFFSIFKLPIMFKNLRFSHCPAMRQGFISTMESPC